MGLAAVGVYSFLHINVEAYPDPAPPTVEVIALLPGASAEEVERQVTVPLESDLCRHAGTAGDEHQDGVRPERHQDALRLRLRLQGGPAGNDQSLAVDAAGLPPGVTPQISPESPTGEIYPLRLRAPKDAAGNNIYTLNDLKALQDWVLEREFRTVPRVVDVTSWGGTVRRYEVQPDPDRMRRYGITLAQLQNALANSNATVGGDYLNQGDVALTVRSVGLFGGGEDPVRKVLGMTDPAKAARVLRDEEDRRIRDIRALVITSVNNQPIRVEDVVEGGRLAAGERAGQAGRGRQPPDPPGPDGPLPSGRRLRVALPRGPFAQRQQGRPRRPRPGGLHRAAAQGRRDAARPEGHRGQGQGAQRPGLGADAARRPDRALLRPHGADQPHDRHRDGEPGDGHRAGGDRSC